MIDQPAAAPFKPRKPAQARSFACPSCGGTVKVTAVGISVTAVCRSCGSLIDIANENLRLISDARQHMRPSLIDIGARGTLAGTEWEVVGRQDRSDGPGSWQWTEYLLFNPFQGFRFLVQDHGHWTLYCMLRQDVSDPSKVWRDSHAYTMFSRGTARTDYVLGEFYWRVRMGDTVRIEEYIAPPYILSREETEGELTWSRGVYLEPEIIAEAFKLSAMPPKTGVAPHQPSPFEGRFDGIRKVAVFATIALLVLHALSFGSYRRQPVFEQTFETNASDRGRVLSSGPFDVPGRGGNLEITVSAPSLTNDWLETDMSLVDQQNDRGFSVLRNVEYYQGRDSGGPWHEGSHYAHAVFASVPGGTYRLMVTPDAGAYTRNGTTLPFTVTVRRHVPSWATFWLGLTLILGFPGILRWRHHRFEARRWENSDLDTGIP